MKANFCNPRKALTSQIETLLGLSAAISFSARAWALLIKKCMINHRAFIAFLILTLGGSLNAQSVDQLEREMHKKIKSHLCQFATRPLECEQKAKRMSLTDQKLCKLATQPDAQEACHFDQVELIYQLTLIRARHQGDLEELKWQKGRLAKADRQALNQRYMKQLNTLLHKLAQQSQVTAATE